MSPPYEVSETGWGEFDIAIRVYFHDPNEKPVTLLHTLKLFQTGNVVEHMSKKLVSEQYDEIIFYEPSIQMHQLLMQPPKPLESQCKLRPVESVPSALIIFREFRVNRNERSYPLGCIIAHTDFVRSILEA